MKSFYPSFKIYNENTDSVFIKVITLSYLSFSLPHLTKMLINISQKSVGYVMNFSSVVVYGALIAACTTVSADVGQQTIQKQVIKKSVEGISLKVLGTYESGLIDESAAEIVAYDARSKRVFVTNANDRSVDVLSIRNPYYPHKLFSIDLDAFGEPNSVAVYRGVVAIAVAADEVDVKGQVVFFNRRGKLLNAVEVGFLPDMLTFSPDGSKLVVANEGEPNDEYTIDPVGSVSVINTAKKIKTLTQDDVATASFERFNNAVLDDSIRIFGPNATVAQDLEPEYVAISADSSTAYVVLQENNGLAVVNLETAMVVDIIGLGTKNYNTIQTAMDASDRDNSVNIQPWPVKGFYMPDSIAAYEFEGKTYIVTANEGDARDYGGFSEEERVDGLDLDASITDAYPSIQDDTQLGRLKTTTVNGDLDNDGDVDQIFAYGGRSFSILNTATGSMVYDSGSDFERITASISPVLFNADDSRSDDKGPEPEALTIGKIAEKTYAFIGLERTGGIMVYDITTPYSPLFVEYINNANLDGDIDAGTAGDVGPEGMVFVSAEKSPTRKPLLVVANEVSGTTTVYGIESVKK
ncbi:MAG: DNA-binding beta-propeller fold protein YncE [Cellvibrionaceae bacterium]|jgi:DNA-binding beta-propeller fold protein YncE